MSLTVGELMRPIDSVISGPAMEPLDLAFVRKVLRFNPTTEDAAIDTWISAARQEWESYTSRHPIAVLRERWLPAFPELIELPAPPLREVVSVSYVGSDGDLVVVSPADYEVIAPQGDRAGCGWIQTTGSLWPTPSVQRPMAVRVRYWAGYGHTRGDVPELVRSAMLMLVGHFHRTRADSESDETGRSYTVPMGFERLANAFRDTALPTKPPRYGLTQWL